MLLLVFDLLLQFCNFTYLDFVFSLHFVSLKKIPRPKLFQPFIHRLNNLILGRFKGNTVLTFPSALFSIEFINRFVEFFFVVLENYFQIYSKILVFKFQKKG